MGAAEAEGNIRAADGEEDGVGIISRGHQPFHKSVAHPGFWKTEVNFHKELFRMGKYPHGEDRLPPVPSLFDCDFLPVPKEFNGYIQILVFIRGREYGGFPSGRRDYAVGVVNAQLASGVDPILSFPEFDEPCFSFIIKIDRLAVHHHIKQRCKFVIDGTVSKLLLPGIRRTGEYILTDIIAIAERLGQFIQQTALFLDRHTADLSYDLPFAEVEEDKEKKDK